MFHHAPTKLAVVVGLLGLLASGCIPVKNVEKAWNASKADESLAGSWVGQGDEAKRLGFIKTDKDFLVTSSTNGLEGGCRSFETHGQQYLIIAGLRAAVLGFDHVAEENKNGTLLRYQIKGDTLTLYSYDGEQLKAAVKDGKVRGEVDENDNVSLSELDEATVKWLGGIADGPGWDAQVYTREKKDEQGAPREPAPQADSGR